MISLTREQAEFVLSEFNSEILWLPDRIQNAPEEASESNVRKLEKYKSIASEIERQLKCEPTDEDVLVRLEAAVFTNRLRRFFSRHGRWPQLADVSPPSDDELRGGMDAWLAARGKEKLT